MSNNMSQEEIDMLVDSYGSDVSNSGSKSTESSSSHGIGLYKQLDFRKPNKLQYDNLGALKQIHEQFAKSLSNYLTMYIRMSIQAEIDFEVIEQLTYQQYLSVANKSSLWGVYNASTSSEESGKFFIEFDGAFCDFYLSRSFGGTDYFEPYEEDMDVKISDINKELSKPLFTNVQDIYEKSWNNSNMVNFDMNMSVVEDNVQNLNLGIMASEMMLIIPIYLSIFQKGEDGDEGEMAKTEFRVGIPYGMIEPILDKLNLSNMLLSHRSDVENEELKTTIQKMSNVIDVFIGETTENFLDILSLKEGDTLILNKKECENYDIHIGGLKKYEGKPYSFKNSVVVKVIK